MFVLLLTGPPGAGKSSVLTALHDRLGEAGVSNAMIEVDELERCYPPLGTERAIAHVGMLCASYREAGYELLFLTATVEDDDYGRALLAATGAEGTCWRASRPIRIRCVPESSNVNRPAGPGWTSWWRRHNCWPVRCRRSVESTWF
ncbi:hypothetical protein ACETU7_22225 [Rhodococcus sp. 3Y1]